MMTPGFCIDIISSFVIHQSAQCIHQSAPLAHCCGAITRVNNVGHQ